MSEKNWNGIFDEGFSGIIDAGRNDNDLPKYLNKLAESEKDFTPEEIKTEDLKFGAQGLTRANELNSDDVRVVESTNKVNKEIEKEAVSDARMKKAVEKLLSQGRDIKQIQKDLFKKFPRNKVKQYFEANNKSIMNKYGQIGYLYLSKEAYDECDGIKEALSNRIREGHNFISKLKVEDNSCNDCTLYKNGHCLLTNLKVSKDPQVSSIEDAKRVLNKFSKNDFINKSIISNYIEKLEKENPRKVISSFLNSMEENKGISRRNDEKNKVGFKRDIDEKILKERKIENNASKNEKIKEDIIDNQVFSSFKESIQSGLSRKEAHVKIAKQFSFKEIDRFYKKFSSEIEKLVKFNQRNNFDTEFKKVDNISQTKNESNFEAEKKYEYKGMFRHAFILMTNGKDLKEICSSLKNMYGPQANKFIKENKKKLEKHYGQIGFTYIDSNIYENCNEMKESYNNLKHAGKQLISCVSGNDQCGECSFNRNGTCEKVGLEISKHPLVRSSRKVKKIFKKAISFVPKSYIEKFSHNLSENNLGLISEFTLGIDEAIRKESKNNEFDVNFPKVSNETKAKNYQELENREKYDEKKMLNVAFGMMTNGKSLSEIKSSLETVFGKQADRFFDENKAKINKHYGQLGYIFMDSNIYANCQGQDLKNAYDGISHVGKNLLYSIKANKKCVGCIFNKQGKCEKVGLMISNHPLVRSSRSARRVLNKANSFVPTSYINKFSSQVSEDGNLKLISQFNLGIKNALNEEKKRIGKVASKNNSIDMDFYKGFQKTNSYNTDIFKNSSSSRFVDEILGE